MLLDNALNKAKVHVYVIRYKGRIVATETLVSDTRWCLHLLTKNLLP